MAPWVCLQCVITVFPDQTHFLWHGLHVNMHNFKYSDMYFNNDWQQSCCRAAKTMDMMPGMCRFQKSFPNFFSNMYTIFLSYDVASGSEIRFSGNIIK